MSRVAEVLFSTSAASMTYGFVATILGPYGDEFADFTEADLPRLDELCCSWLMWRR